MNKKEETGRKLLEVIEELQDHALYHFQTEEVLMQKANSPDSELHIIQHEFFIKKMKEFRIDYNYNNSVLLNQIVIFMRKWLLIHISEVDGKYVETIQQFLLKDGSN